MIFMPGCKCCSPAPECDCGCPGGTAPDWGRPEEFMLRCVPGAPTRVTGAALSPKQLAEIQKLAATNVCMECNPLAAVSGCLQCAIDYTGTGIYSSWTWSSGLNLGGTKCEGTSARISFGNGSTNWRFSYTVGATDFAGTKSISGGIEATVPENFCKVYTKFCEVPDGIALSGLSLDKSAKLTLSVSSLSGSIANVVETTIEFGNARFSLEKCCTPCDCPPSCTDPIPDSVTVTLNTGRPDGGGGEALAEALDGLTIVCDRVDNFSVSESVSSNPAYYRCLAMYEGRFPVDVGEIRVTYILACAPLPPVESPDPNPFGGTNDGLLMFRSEPVYSPDRLPFQWNIGENRTVTFVRFWFSGLKASIDIPEPTLSISTICRGEKSGEYDASLAQDFNLGANAGYSAVGGIFQAYVAYFPEATLTVTVA